MKKLFLLKLVVCRFEFPSAGSFCTVQRVGYFSVERSPSSDEYSVTIPLISSSNVPMVLSAPKNGSRLLRWRIGFDATGVASCPLKMHYSPIINAGKEEQEG